MSYKILVVDDEKDIVEVVSKKLKAHDYEVAVAYDGEEALSKVQEEEPDIMLLDLMMPKLNGFEVLQKVRESFTKKWIPVIIVSANTDLNSVNKSYGLEADHYLTKPCSFEAILRGIETMISLIPLRKQPNQ